MTSKTRRLPRTLGLVSAAVLALACVAAEFAPPKEPASLEVSVSPDAVRPGAIAHFAVTITPKDGVKINRYPKLRLSVDERPGLFAAGEVALGNDAPPDLDAKDGTNYFDRIEPLTLALAVDGAAPAGQHQFEARLTYFYCVTASGFCAPHRQAVRFTLDVAPAS